MTETVKPDPLESNTVPKTDQPEPHSVPFLSLLYNSASNFLSHVVALEPPPEQELDRISNKRKDSDGLVEYFYDLTGWKQNSSREQEQGILVEQGWKGVVQPEQNIEPQPEQNIEPQPEQNIKEEIVDPSTTDTLNQQQQNIYEPKIPQIIHEKPLIDATMITKVYESFMIVTKTCTYFIT
jgi:hypothetical protein